MKEYALEIGREIKLNAEVGGRSEANLIDALNASYDYGYTKESHLDHIKNNKLSFVPYKHSELEFRQSAYNQNFNQRNKDSYLQAMEKSERLREFQGKLLSTTGTPDLARTKAQLINSIPESFLGCLPIN